MKQVIDAFVGQGKKPDISMITHPRLQMSAGTLYC
jgi:hypothetical protein